MRVYVQVRYRASLASIGSHDRHAVGDAGANAVEWRRKATNPARALPSDVTTLTAESRQHVGIPMSNDVAEADLEGWLANQLRERDRREYKRRIACANVRVLSRPND